MVRRSDGTFPPHSGSTNTATSFANNDLTTANQSEKGAMMSNGGEAARSSSGLGGGNNDNPAANGASSPSPRSDEEAQAQAQTQAPPPTLKQQRQGQRRERPRQRDADDPGASEAHAMVTEGSSLSSSPSSTSPSSSSGRVLSSPSTSSSPGSTNAMSVSPPPTAPPLLAYPTGGDGDERSDARATSPAVEAEKAVVAPAGGALAEGGGVVATNGSDRTVLPSSASASAAAAAAATTTAAPGATPAAAAAAAVISNTPCTHSLSSSSGGCGAAGADAGGNSGKSSDDALSERLSRQVESLLARVEFLEKERSLERSSDWEAGYGGGEETRRSRSGSAFLHNRRGSGGPPDLGFLPEEHSGSRGGGGVGDQMGTLLVTPPPPRLRVRDGSMDVQHAIGVSTTPFTGLDVLFRTPKQPQEASNEQTVQHLYHLQQQQQQQQRLLLLQQPPVSPSRGEPRWADPILTTNGSNGGGDPSRSPRRSRLTWCAGEEQSAIEARGGRAPPPPPASGGSRVEGPGSPPLYRLLGENSKCGKWALEAPASPSNLDGGDDGRFFPRGGEGFGSSRPRCATEGLAGGRRERDGRAKNLFISTRDSGRSDHESYSPSGSTKRGSPKRPKSPRSPRSSHSPLLGRRDGEGKSQGEGGGGGTREERGVSSSCGAEDGGDGGVPGGVPQGGTAATGPISLLGYLRVEVFGAEDHGVVDAQANRTVRNVLTVPRQLERLLLFGMLVCLDTFLYVTTFLPIRIVIGLVSALFSVVTRRSAPRVNRPLLYDWMRGATIAAALGALQFLEMSRVYHYIRGQAMVKLYVLIAMVEIFDKLMCSFGQDALDSLYLSTVHKKKRRVVVHFTIVCVTACLHSLLLFVHVTTLTVAVNSSDQALLTLLISNNFAEIKSSVFKKFDKHNLFQLSCHDVVERFKLALFLAMIMLLNVCQGGRNDPVSQFLTIFVLVFGGEVLVDWIKHGFIIKFNQLTPSIYDEYSTILARDVAAFRKDDGSTLDHTHFVARRLAFATAPLNCVMIRYIQMAIPKLLQTLPEAPRAALWIMAVLFYLLALALKILTGITLMAQSCSLHPDAVISSTAAASWLRSPVHGGHKTRKELSLEKLSTIERFTLWKGRIV